MNKLAILIIVVLVLFILLFGVLILVSLNSGTKTQTKTPETKPETKQPEPEPRKEYPGGVWVNDNFVYFKAKDIWGYDYGAAENMTPEKAMQYALNDPLIKSFTLLNDNRAFYKYIGKDKMSELSDCKNSNCGNYGAGIYINMNR